MSGSTRDPRAAAAGVRGLGPMVIVFALSATVEMLLMAPPADLLSPRVWWAVLSTHAVVALGVILGAAMARALAAALGRTALAPLRDGALGRWTLGDWALALTAAVLGFAHGWPVVKEPLVTALGRPLALGLAAVGLLASYGLLRRWARESNRQLVLPMVCAFAALLGYYLLRAHPLGLAGPSRPASLSGVLLFAIVVVVILLRPWRHRAAILAGLLLGMVVCVRAAAPAPHSPILGRLPAPATDPLPAVASAPPVLLIVIDTLRADALDLDRDRGGRTPNLARLAAGSDVFARAVANASWTLPAHASLFTGLRVSRHRVDMTSSQGFGAKLDESLPTLHERFAARGYATSCIAANGIVGPASDLTRGCARYRHPGRAWTLQTAPLRLWYALSPSARPALEEQMVTQATGLRRHATAAEVLSLALAELDAATAPPYLFLNLMDVHRPYPAAPDISAAQTASFLFDLGGVLAGLGDPEVFDRRHVEWMRRSYLAQLARLDGELGRFLTALRERHLYDEALIVVTADHGEAFFDNPDLPLYYDHHGAYEAAVRVPLIVKRPGQTAGRRFAHFVEQADLAPAILDLAAGGRGGGRLFTPERGAPALTEWNPHPTPGAMSTLPAQRVGLYRDDYKLVLEGDWRRAPATRLFDLAGAPFESVEVSARDPLVAERLRVELLETLGREWDASAAGGADGEEPSPELLETLRALGYIE